MMVGETIGHYKILEQLGQGGMATVYRAVHLQLDVERAIKIIRPEFGADEAFRARFRQEAQAIARMRHPHIVQLHDYGLEGNQPYMVMEFVQGQDLKARLAERGPIRPIRDLIPIMRQIAGALDYAHKRGIIHRDIKPANILLQENNQAILTDFGIAQMLESQIRLTQTGAMMGTPSYMAPEQVRSEPTSTATDIYGLGIVVYEMITGRVPFSADTPYAVLLKVANDPLPEPRQFAADIPAGVQAAVLKATAREAQDRYPTATAFIDALEGASVAGVASTVYDSQPDLAASLPPKTPPTGRAESKQPTNQWPLILALFVVACVVLAAVAGGIWFLTSREQPVLDTPATPTITPVAEAVVENTAVAAVETAPATSPAAETATAAPTETTTSGIPTAMALPGEAFLLSDANRVSENPEALRDIDGTLHVAWLERDPQNPIQRIWHRSQTPGGTWSEADLLYDEGLVNALKLSLDSDGYPCVFWDSGLGPHQRCYETGSWTEQQALPLTGRDWMPAVNAQGEFTSTTIIGAGTLVLGNLQLSDDEAAAFQPQFTIDSTGRYHTFWIRTGNPYSLEHRWSGDNGQTWEEAVMLSDPDMTSIQTDFAIAPDNQGRVHLAFMLPGIERRVAYRVWEEGLWSETEFLEDPGAGLISLDIALDSAGRPALAWVESQMALTRQLPDGSWSTPTIILSDIQTTSLDSFKLSFATDELLDIIGTNNGQILTGQIGRP